MLICLFSIENYQNHALQVLWEKRRELLRQFGGLQGIVGAGVDDLVKVHGISRKLAETIYNELHLDHQ